MGGIRSTATVTGSLPLEAALVKNADGSAITSPIYADCTYDAESQKWICSTPAPDGYYGIGAQLMRLKGSNPPITAGSTEPANISGGSTPTRRVATMIGDSITGAEATGNNTDGYTGGTGPGYFVQMKSRLGNPANVDFVNEGFGGKGPQWFIDNRLAAVKAKDYSQYASPLVFSVGFVGGNGLSDQVSPNDATTEYNAVATLCAELKTIRPGAVQILLLPYLNRSDSHAASDFDTKRTAVNTQLAGNATSIATVYAPPSEQRTIYLTASPQNATYCFDGVHLTGSGGSLNGGGAGILAELAAKYIAPLLGLTLPAPAYRQDIDYTGGVAQIDPDSLNYSFVQVAGPGVSQPADRSSVRQDGVVGGNFDYTAVGVTVGRRQSGQAFVADQEFTVLSANLTHVFGLITASTAGNDGDIEIRLYPEGNGRVRIWTNVSGGSVNVYDGNPGVANNDKFRFRTYTDRIEVTQNGNLLKSIVRPANDLREFRAAIAFGNESPGDTLILRQRGVNIAS